MLGFNDGFTPDTNTKWYSLLDRINWFTQLGVAKTVFVLPDDSNRLDAGLGANRDGNTVHFVCEAFRWQAYAP